MSDETPGVGQGALPPREGQGLRTMAERPAASGTTVRVAQVVGGQYVLTTQSHGMPALAQITPGNLTGNSNITRLISISPSRVGQASPLRPSLANQSIVNVLTKARPNSNVRLQLFPSTESSGNNVQHNPHARSLKRPLSSIGEKKDYTTKLQHVMNHRIVRSKLVKEKYNEHLLEAYYLETGNNILDLYQFAKRPKTQAYLTYLKEHSIDPRDYPELPTNVNVPQTTLITPSATSSSSLPGISHSYSIQTTTPTVTTPESHGNTSTPKSVSVKMKSTSHTSSASQEMIVEKAKQEAYVVQRIADLQKDGLWSEKRLPKLQEMPRAKAHWDFLLEEMVWLAADFAQERKWKKAAAKKCARMVQKYFQDKALAAQRAEKAHEQNLRRIAAFCAKEVKNFWNNVEKLVEYKQNTILEEKRKKALDQQLSFIVDQTEKYSQLLAEGMNKTAEQPPSSAPSRSVSRAQSDTEFDPDLQSDEDDEETIAQEEAALGNAGQKEEIEALQKESQMELDDLLEDDLLRNYLLNRDKIRLSESENSEDEADTKKEGTSRTDEESEDSDSSKEEEECEDSEEESEVEIKVTETTQGEHEELKILVEDSQKEGEIKTEKDSKDDLINDAAAIAESIQPKGNTLSSTNVSTNIPFLLKYSLREYQHIGLDWLVTMFDRKLNGILADEMGLGKTIQTIALLAHLACEKENWGPHLIVVPTSVMLNWEMECKKWCPAFKILTYYGSQKERKFKRIGWTKPNAFHICITSYKLVIQDHQSFRRKKWKYLILDEAQNIKNFKSQRWQLLLNFQTQQRLLLTGTPLQNNLMELWSLMHFLMPNVFQSHREFKEWFSNPVTGMIEGNSEYNESIIKRLHKVLRPFLLRRLKSEVEKQMPKKYEHVVMCRLSKRQRYLYDDYMSRAKTRETLASGNLLSVINVLMQLRKVCNHPNLFEVRPTTSPFQCEGIRLHIPSLVYSALDYDYTKHVNLQALNLLLLIQEIHFGSYQCYRMRQSRNSKKIMEMDQINAKNPPPCPPCKLAMRVLPDKPVNEENKAAKKEMPVLTPSQPPPLQLKGLNQPNMKVKVSGVQLVNPQGILKTIPVVNISQGTTNQIGTPVSVTSVLKPPDKISASFAQLVQTSTGKHLLLTSNPNITANIPVTTTTGGQKLTFLSKQPVSTICNAGHAVTKAYVKFQLTSVTTATTFTTVTTANSNTLSVVKSDDNKNKGRTSVGIDYIGKLYSKQNSLDVRWNSDEKNVGLTNEVDPKGERRNRLALMTRINKIRCSALPLYGRDFQDAVKIFSPNKKSVWDRGSIHCLNSLYNKYTSESTDCLKDLLYNPERRLDDLKDTFDRFIFYVPAVKAVEPELQVWHPPPSKYWGQKRDKLLLQKLFLKPATPLHSIASAMVTQFPDPRLIQYDCGKLQTLDKLLRKLKAEGHRALIFTQMTKMLDVLEAFLNYHGHIYLRLDGTTKVDQRQVLMERFNGDKRIFAFILSTRSGGVGVNLTGADTVIFYDSDWNPTMDAQAQDRCHRIGQTRDVHIYRLVSERTIEENILKKANQKRLLGDLAIEGGNFTTAYFKSSTIQDLFNIDQNEENAAARMSEMIEIKKDREKALSVDSLVQIDDKNAVGALESALAACEDDQDVQAAKTAKAEAVADLAEFDENIPLDEQEKEPEVSKAEQEINNVIEKLTPIEKYAMKFIEATESAWSAEQLAAAEREIEEQKREWEQNRLAAMKEEEERRARELEEDGDIITFSREDANNQVSFKTKKLRTSKLLGNKEKRGRISKKMQLSDGKDKKLHTRRFPQKPKEDIPQELQIFESSQIEESHIFSDSDNTIASVEYEENNEQKSASNHVDHNSPRTRSRGTVAINLWTLDVSPILPGEKPLRKQENNHRKLSKRYKSISEDDNDSQPDSESRKPLHNKRKRRRKINNTLDHSEDDDKSVASEDLDVNNTGPNTITTKAKNCKVVLNNIMKDKRFKIPEIMPDEMEISVELNGDTKQTSANVTTRKQADKSDLNEKCRTNEIEKSLRNDEVSPTEMKPMETDQSSDGGELDESISEVSHTQQIRENWEAEEEFSTKKTKTEANCPSSDKHSYESKTDEDQIRQVMEASALPKVLDEKHVISKTSLDNATLGEKVLRIDQLSSNDCELDESVNDAFHSEPVEKNYEAKETLSTKNTKTGANHFSSDESKSEDILITEAKKTSVAEESAKPNKPSSNNEELDESILDDILDDEFPTEDEEVDEDALLEDTVDELTSDKHIKDEKFEDSDITHSDKEKFEKDEQNTVSFVEKNSSKSLEDSEEKSEAEQKRESEEKQDSESDEKDADEIENKHAPESVEKYSDELEQKFTGSETENEHGHKPEEHDSENEDNRTYEPEDKHNSEFSLLNDRSEIIAGKTEEVHQNKVLENDRKQDKHNDIIKELKKESNEVKSCKDSPSSYTICDNSVQKDSSELSNNHDQNSESDRSPDESATTMDSESPKENVNVNNKVDNKSNHLDNGIKELSKIPTVVSFNRNANFRSPDSRRNYKKFGRYSNNRTLDGWVRRSPVGSSKVSENHSRQSFSERPD